MLRAGGNAVDAALAAMLTSFVAEPLLTGSARAATCSSAAPGASPCCSTSSSRRPAQGADPSARARRSSPSTSPSATPSRSSTSARRRSASTATPAGHLRGARGASARCRSPSSPRRPRRWRARGVPLNAAAGLHLRHPRADHGRHAGVARAASCRPGGPPREGEPCSRPRRSATRSSGSGRRARRRSTRATSPPPWSSGCAERGGMLTARGPRAPTSTVAREPVRVALPRARGAHQPAADRGRHPDRLRARPARPRAPARRAVARARRGDGARAGRAHGGVHSTGSTEPGFADALPRLAAGLDDAHLGRSTPTGCACSVTCTNGEGSGPSSCPAPACTSTT